MSLVTDTRDIPIPYPNMCISDHASRYTPRGRLHGITVLYGAVRDADGAFDCDAKKCDLCAGRSLRCEACLDLSNETRRAATARCRAQSQSQGEADPTIAERVSAGEASRTDEASQSCLSYGAAQTAVERRVEAFS